MLFLLMSVLWQAPPAPAASFDGRMLEKGSQSYIDLPRQVVARTQAEFDAIWKQHAPGRPQPAVDFGMEMVVGVFLGSRSTAAYSVDIVGAAEVKAAERAAFVVRYRENAPPKTAIVAQVITMPYYLAAVPRYAGDVRFEKAP